VAEHFSPEWRLSSTFPAPSVPGSITFSSTAEKGTLVIDN
jgi:hypothetical protein